MADFSLRPVAADIKPIPSMSLSEVMNLARGAQSYQQAEQMNPLLLQQQRQTVGMGEVNLTLARQQEAERSRIQQFLSNPENYQTNNRVDINKLNSAVTKIAPLTGADWMQKFTTLNTAQTEADKAAQELTSSERGIIASSMGVMGRLNINDKRAYLNELDQIKKLYPNNPGIQKTINAYKATLDALPDNANFAQLAIAGANQLLTPSQQQTTFAPQPGTISTGAATFPTTTRPSVAGEAPVVSVGKTPLVTAQLPPGSREVFTGQYDQNNMPIVNVYDPSGRFLGQRSGSETPGEGALPGMQTPRPVEPAATQPGMTGVAPGAQPQMARQPLPALGVEQVKRLPPGETQQTFEAANKIRMSASDAASQVPMQTFNNNQIIKIADDVATGKGAGMLANLTGGYAALPWTSDNATNLNKLGDYMAKQQVSLAQAAGIAGSDAGRALAAETVGSTSWTADAIKHTARVNRALATTSELFNRGVQNAFLTSKRDAFSVREFQDKWSQSVDLNAIRLYDAIKNNDKQGIQEIVNQVGGPKSAKYNDLKNKIAEMQRMIGVK